MENNSKLKGSLKVKYRSKCHFYSLKNSNFEEIGDNLSLNDL